ncbi:Non-specific serine/threonine protein kinase [Bertholletia excelsa]
MALRLPNMGLIGTLSPFIGNLSFLKIIDLSNNSFHGNIVSELGKLPYLETVFLDENQFEGEIPASIQHCRKLQVISFHGNFLTGSIPVELTTLPSLKTLFVGMNNLSGRIPASIGNMSSLEWLGLEMNNIFGEIPHEMGHLPNLKGINFYHNLLTGSISPSLFNISSLEEILLTDNDLSGTLYPSIRIQLPNLEKLTLDKNQFTGEIPLYLLNSSKLDMLVLAANRFTGQVPPNLGQLKLLQVFSVQGNHLTVKPRSSELGFLDSMTNCTSLQYLIIADNPWGGILPDSIGNLSRTLQLFAASSSQLKGKIPEGIGSLKLQRLYLQGNQLEGPISNEICLLNNLGEIYMQDNKLNGPIPSCIGNLSQLQRLFINSNELNSSLPSSPIPASIGDLRALNTLDLSHNNLSGAIPKTLESLFNLKFLNFSFNMLSGEIPSQGPFRNLTALSFLHNGALCGELPRLQVPLCTSHKTHKSWTNRFLKFILPPIVFVIILVSCTILWKNHQRKVIQNSNPEEPSPTVEHKMISYRELCIATNNFSDSNLLGVGSFSSVYKGTLLDGTTVAVKILNLQVEGAFKSFNAECKILRTVRHRNLVKVISTCSNPDLRALILQYMLNGSLNKWLYSHEYSLDIIQRLVIMIDVAVALEYLHHSQAEPIVHCDLKPAIVLLDEEMIGHVADFGISKILAESKTATQTETLGTPGYIAPEYGSEGIVTTKGDKPTDEMFNGELSLRKWVKASIPNKFMEVMDFGLLNAENRHHLIAPEDNLLSIMELALHCSADLPEERPDIKDVVAKLNKIKFKLICGGQA